MLPICDHSAIDLETNLALDEALLQAVEAGEVAPLVRVWEWPRLAVVLGASSHHAEDVHLEACQADGVPLTRRASGGGTVMLGPGALNVTIVLPVALAEGLESVDRAHAYVLERLAESLRGQGVPVDVQGSGDLAIGGRKCAGSAQRRLKRHFLVHTSILDMMDLTAIARYLAQPRRQPDYRQGRPHTEFVTNLNLGRPGLVAAIQAAWCAPRPETLGFAALPWTRAAALVAEKYSDPSWIRRF
jgi:lipoate-protein ligase A